MRLRKANIAVSVILSACLLSACSTSISSDSSTSSPANSESSSSEVSCSQQSTEDESSAAQSVNLPSATPSATAMEQMEFSDLSFLTEDQRELYETACDMSYGLYGMGANLMDLWGFRPLMDGEGKQIIVDENYVLYDMPYDAFSERVHQVFTDACLSMTDYAIKFMEHDGYVALDELMADDMVEGTTIQVNEAYPDTYRLVCGTGDIIEFTLISHYDRNGWNDKDDPIDVYTIEYPIRMVNTDDGWRIEEFHTTRFG